MAERNSVPVRVMAARHKEGKGGYVGRERKGGYAEQSRVRVSEGESQDSSGQHSAAQHNKVLLPSTKRALQISGVLGWFQEGFRWPTRLDSVVETVYRVGPSATAWHDMQDMQDRHGDIRDAFRMIDVTSTLVAA